MDKNALALKKITRATIELSSSPIFDLLSGMLAALRHRASDKIPTACTDGLNVEWNAEWVCSMPNKQIAFVLAHEAGHSILMHNVTTVRLKFKNPTKCAHAVDHVVNNM